MNLDLKKIAISLFLVLFSHLEAQILTKSKLDITLGPSINNFGLAPKDAIFLPGFNTGITLYDRLYLSYFNSSIRTREDEFEQSQILKYRGFNLNYILFKPQNKMRFTIGVTTYETLSKEIRNDSFLNYNSRGPGFLPTIGLRLKLNEKLKLDIHYNGLVGSLGLTYRLAIVEEKSNYNQSKPLEIN